MLCFATRRGSSGAAAVDHLARASHDCRVYRWDSAFDADPLTDEHTYRMLNFGPMCVLSF
jgi:hypothetical protein